MQNGRMLTIRFLKSILGLERTFGCRPLQRTGLPSQAFYSINITLFLGILAKAFLLRILGLERALVVGLRKGQACGDRPSTPSKSYWICECYQRHSCSGFLGSRVQCLSILYKVSTGRPDFRFSIIIKLDLRVLAKGFLLTILGLERAFLVDLVQTLHGQAYRARHSISMDIILDLRMLAKTFLFNILRLERAFSVFLA